jgi:S1-C subfamily serine protease
MNTGSGTNVTSAAEKVIPAVVGITVTRTEGGSAVQGVGSGVIVDSSGYILTNNHVAGGDARDIVVSLYDGRDLPGTTVWAEPVLDLAIVKVNAGRLTTAALGDSKTVLIGEQAIAIGNPLGLTFQRTVTAGIISAVNRTIEVASGTFMEDLIQTDASINPGNSGGPLINVRGEVVGINTIKVTSAEAMGFAVPINVAKPVIDRFRSGNGYSAPDVSLQVLDRELRRAYNFVLDKGVYVYDCRDGGCAHRAGIKKGDVIMSINGKPVSTALELREELYRTGADNMVNLMVRTTGGIEKNVSFKLDGIK